MSSNRQTLICAIYTRKSSEEGLEQGFNSLDAQREACEAFILSQQHEGWRALTTMYDDGGYSGGTMVRPSLKRLLEDIDNKRIQVVVVYKVDRLSRSLADFAKIVELFDSRGVSFVSVTQQFNTTSSMGRLTLNVLLSFAQFEREVTGERIRDKIAASKQRGMWMGGTPPIGYRGNERTLDVEESSASLVRHIFTRYLKLGGVQELKRELDDENLLMPNRVSNAGNTYGGLQFSRGQLYRILTNPIYIGQIPHRGKTYQGQHPGIIDQELWDTVQAKLISNKQGQRQRSTAPSGSLLMGLIVDGRGRRLVPSHSQKQSKRYRYYVSELLTKSSREHDPEGIRLPAQEVETLVVDALRNWLKNDHAVLESLSFAEPGAIQAILTRAHRLATVLENDGEERCCLVRRMVAQVKIFPESVVVMVHIDELMDNEEGCDQDKSPQQSIDLTIPAKLTRCSLGMRLLIQGPQHTQRQTPDARLISVLGKAHDWFGRLTSGKAKSIGEIAATEGISNTHVTCIIYRAFLAPDIVRAILDGRQPASLTLESLKKYQPLPIDWDEQRKLLGFTPS